MLYIHGKRDTYNHRAANRFLWDTAGTGPSGDNLNDYDNMYRFWKGLNEFRSGPHGQVFRVSEPVPEGYFKWFLPEDESLLGYLVDGKVLVLLNAGSSEYRFSGIMLPEGSWKLVATNSSVNHLEGVKDEKVPARMKGGGSVDINMGPESLRIWVVE